MYHILQKPLPVTVHKAEFPSTPVVSGIRAAQAKPLLRAEFEANPVDSKPCLHHLYYRKCLLER